MENNTQVKKECEYLILYIPRNKYICEVKDCHDEPLTLNHFDAIRDSSSAKMEYYLENNVPEFYKKDCKIVKRELYYTVGPISEIDIGTPVVEKTAKEMFEEAGWEFSKYDKYLTYEEFHKDDPCMTFTFSILFVYDNKEVWFEQSPYRSNNYVPFILDMDTMKIVNKRLEELGW